MVFLISYFLFVTKLESAYLSNGVFFFANYVVMIDGNAIIFQTIYPNN